MPLSRHWPLLAVLLLAACAPKAPRFPGPLHPIGDYRASLSPSQPVTLPQMPDALPPPVAVVRRRSGKGNQAVAEAAKHWLDHTPRGFRDDCSGFVMAVLDRAGTPEAGNTRSFWESAVEGGRNHRRKIPDLGDLVFFDNTYDRNRNGRLDDSLTHIGVVTSVLKNGTITVAHGGTSKGRSTMQMNLLHPSARNLESGEEANDWLRAKSSRDKPGTPHLSGELWKGFASPPTSDGLAESQ